MPTVTVSGGADVELELHYDSRENAALARTLADTINRAIADGRMVTSTDVLRAPLPPPGTVGEVVRTTSGTTLLNAADTAVVVTARSAVMIDGGAQGQTVLSGSGALTYLAHGGSGEIVTGGGRFTFVAPSIGAGNWAIHSGGGDDLIIDGSGNDTIDAGGGHNAVVLGSGNSVVTFSGRGEPDDGFRTSHRSSEYGDDREAGGSGRMAFIGHENASTVGGAEATLTVYGGEGAGLFARGRADDGSGGRDTPDRPIRAASGNDTLDGALGDGGPMHDHHGDRGGSVQNTVFLGSGNATVDGGFGRALAVFTKGAAGGADLLKNFTPDQGSTVQLDGYGRAEVAQALATQTTAAGSTTITLSDKTKITFADVSHVDRTFFT